MANDPVSFPTATAEGSATNINAPLRQLLTQSGLNPDSGFPGFMTYPVLGTEVSVTQPRFPYGDVRRFGAVGNGAADDSTAIQNAMTSVAAVGGDVYFPPGTYKVTTTCTLSSLNVVNLIGDRSVISIGGPIAGAVFDVGCARGVIRGLWFTDPTYDAGVGQGTRTVTAALLLTSFSEGLVEHCYFSYVKGSAIKAINFQRGNIRSNVILGCGAASKPAVYFASNAGAGLVCQAVVFSDNKMESCLSAEYVQLGTGTADVRLANNQFEADEAIAATNQKYLLVKAARVTCIGNLYNRNLATFVSVETDAEAFLSVGNQYTGTPTGLPQFISTVANIDCIGDVFIGSGAATGTCIDTSANGYSNFTGCRVYINGNVKMGPYSTWTGGALSDLATTQPYAFPLLDFSSVVGVKIRDSASTGGIKITGQNCTVTGNVVKAMGGVGIRNESVTSLIKGNNCYGNTGGDFTTNVTPKAYAPEDNNFHDGVAPLASRRVHNGTGAVACNNTVATTLFAIPATAGKYEVYVWVSGQGAAYTAKVTIVQSGAGGAAPQLLGNAAASASIALSLSGSNLQATQSSGGTATVNYGYEFLSTY